MSFISNLSSIFKNQVNLNNNNFEEENNNNDLEEEIELPLLEELDIDFRLVFKKIISLFFFKASDSIIWKEPDFTGPFIYIMILTVLLLLVK